MLFQIPKRFEGKDHIRLYPHRLNNIGGFIKYCLYLLNMFSCRVISASKLIFSRNFLLLNRYNNHVSVLRRTLAGFTKHAYWTRLDPKIGSYLKAFMPISKTIGAVLTLLKSPPVTVVSIISQCLPFQAKYFASRSIF